MIQLNLLPDVKKDLIHAHRQRNFVISICIFISIAAGSVVVILGGILGGQAIQKGILTESISKSKQTIETKKSDDQLNEYLTIQNQLSQIDVLKSDQLVYSRLFQYLKQLNPASPNNVSLASIKVTSPDAKAATPSTKVRFELQGTTSNYAAQGVFETTLSLAKLSFSKSKDANVQTQALFSSVKTTASAITRDNQLDFTMILECDPVAFDSSILNIKLEIPSETTSDSDRNTPKNVFNTSSTSSDSTTTSTEETQ